MVALLGDRSCRGRANVSFDVIALNDLDGGFGQDSGVGSGPGRNQVHVGRRYALIESDTSAFTVPVLVFCIP